jgi:2-polyprenyl-3-methyl-5-hydroxy-6-metoxy-1,4-benzoquinol methylase
MKCPFCQEDGFTPVYDLSTYRVVRCSRCGLLYNRDFPESEALGETFSEHYYTEVQREAFAHIANQARGDASRPIYELGLGLVPPAGSGRLLDIGCAFGAFMELARSRGWSVSGVEISPFSSRYAREERGLDVFTGDVSSAPLPSGQFDVVTLWDVIEHVRDVRQTLDRARELLKPGGHVIVTTDNFDGLIARLGSTIHTLSLGLAQYPIRRFFIPYNSCYLTPRDLRLVFEATGFEATVIRGIDYPLEKINLTGVEALLLRWLYAAGRWFGMTSQVLVVARRR